MPTQWRIVDEVKSGLKQRWVAPTAAVVAFELAFAWSMNLAYGRSAHLPLLDYVMLFSCLAVGGCSPIVVWWAWELRNSDKPGSDLLRRILSVRIAPLLIGLPLAAMHFSALTWVKPVVPMVAGFWADPVLARIDGFIIDWWRVAHAIAGPRNVVIDWIYALWFPVCIGVLSCVLLSTHRSRGPAIVSFFCIGCTCILFQFALPSAGPIFFALTGNGDRFAELGRSVPYMAQKGAEYLWLFHIGAERGRFVGISAMPSVHVAMAVWVAMAVSRIWRRMRPWAISWAGLIAFGSVYLGWHYALDGVAAAFISLAGFRASEGLASRSLHQGAPAAAV